MLGLRLRKLAERGDTIVEVLIAIAVISMILGGAYVTTNKSLQGTRAAQERSDALKLTESQLEAMKALAGTDGGGGLFANGLGDFCIYNQAIIAATSSNCTVNAKGTPSGAQPAYTLKVTRTNTNTFTVRATWTAIERSGTDSLDMTYRIYQQ